MSVSDGAWLGGAGMKIVGYDDIKEGDVLECYKKVEVKRTLGG